MDTKNESKIIVHGSDNVGGFIGSSSTTINTIEKSGIYQGIISSSGQAGKTISFIYFTISLILSIYFILFILILFF